MATCQQHGCKKQGKTYARLAGQPLTYCKKHLNTLTILLHRYTNSRYTNDTRTPIISIKKRHIAKSILNQIKNENKTEEGEQKNGP